MVGQFIHGNENKNSSRYTTSLSHSCDGFVVWSSSLRPWLRHPVLPSTEVLFSGGPHKLCSTLIFPNLSSSNVHTLVVSLLTLSAQRTLYSCLHEDSDEFFFLSSTSIIVSDPGSGAIGNLLTKRWGLPTTFVSNDPSRGWRLSRPDPPRTLERKNCLEVVTTTTPGPRSETLGDKSEQSRCTQPSWPSSSRPHLPTERPWGERPETSS